MYLKAQNEIEHIILLLLNIVQYFMQISSVYTHTMLAAMLAFFYLIVTSQLSTPARH